MLFHLQDHVLQTFCPRWADYEIFYLTFLVIECLEDHLPKSLCSHWDILPFLHLATNNPKCRRKKHARWLKWEVGVTEWCGAVSSSLVKTSNHSPQNANKYSHSVLHDILWDLPWKKSIVTQKFLDNYKLGTALCPTKHYCRLGLSRAQG